MELHVLGDDIRGETVIDTYTSCVWTERRSAWGDFTLDIKSSKGIKDLLEPGTWLSHSRSNRVMVTETFEDKVSDAGEAMLTVTGRSLEAWLDDRVGMPALASLATTPKWNLSGLPVDIIKQIFKTICVDGALSAADILPYYAAGNIEPLGTIAAPTDSITVGLDPDSVYNQIKMLCEMYNLGFRITRNKENQQLFFNVYTGDNRTSAQTTFNAVIFSPQLDNLKNTNELTSTADYKNVAYVYGQNGSQIVYADGADPSVSGFDRRVLLVNASDITLAAGSADLATALLQRGKQELANHRTTFAFDGEIPQSGGPVYGKDYYMGDLVELRGVYNNASNMRVVEQIFVSDSKGDREYPTLALDILITPDSWYSWGGNKVWNDVPDTAFWANV